MLGVFQFIGCPTLQSSVVLPALSGPVISIVRSLLFLGATLSPASGENMNTMHRITTTVGSSKRVHRTGGVAVGSKDAR